MYAKLYPHLESVIVMNDNRHPEVNVTPLILMLETKFCPQGHFLLGVVH